MKYKLVIIIAISLFFRFYKLSDWLFFGMDQEYEALIIQNLLELKHIPLIGVNASDTGLYLGPLFIYIASIPYALFGGNPLGGAITASLLGVITTLALYRIGRELFTKRIGAIASICYASSFLIAYYDRQFWNPTPVPLLSLVMGLSLFKVLQKNLKYFYIFFVLLGFSLHIHLSLLIFLPISIYVFWKQRNIFTRRTIVSGILLFLLLQTPQIVFEFRHNLTNSKAIINLITGERVRQMHNSVGFYEKNDLLVSSLARIIWVPPKPDLYLESGQCVNLSKYRKDPGIEMKLIVIAVLVYFIFLIRRKMHYYYLDSRRIRAYHIISSHLIVSLLFISSFIFITINSGTVFEYYFLYLFPWFCLIIGFILSKLWNLAQGRISVLFLLLVYVSINSVSLLSARFSFSYKEKLELINQLKPNLSGSSYALEAVGGCPRYGGYRYLFEHFLPPPTNSYMDSYFGWLYPEKIDYNKTNKILLLSLIDPRENNNSVKMWQEDKMKYLLRFTILEQKRTNSIEAFILELQK